MLSLTGGEFRKVSVGVSVAFDFIDHRASVPGVGSDCAVVLTAPVVPLLVVHAELSARGEQFLPLELAQLVPDAENGLPVRGVHFLPFAALLADVDFQNLQLRAGGVRGSRRSFVHAGTYHALNR